MPTWTGYDAYRAAKHQWALVGELVASDSGQEWRAIAIVPVGKASQGTAWQAVADGLRHEDETAGKALCILASHAPEEFKRMVKSCPGFRNA